MKSSYVDETGSFKPDAFEAVDPDTAKKLVMAELQQQVQDAARDNAVLGKAMNNLLAAAVEVDTTAEDAAETANLMALAQPPKQRAQTWRKTS